MKVTNSNANVSKSTLQEGLQRLAHNVLWKMSLGALATFGLVACSQGSPSASKVNGGDGLRSLSKAEAKSDFVELSQAIRAYYGPLQYKEQRFNFKADDLLANADKEVDAATNDAEVFGAYQRLLVSLHDAHVSIAFPSSSAAASKYSIPIFITPVDGHALVEAIDPSLKDAGISRGDELLSIDGKTPKELLPIIKKYKTYSNDVSDEHLIYMALSRPFYVKELIPTKTSAHLVMSRPEGSIYTLDLVWRVAPAAGSSPQLVPSVAAIPARLNFTVSGLADFNEAAGSSLMQMGAAIPYFSNARTNTVFNWVKVEPNADFLKKYSLTAATAPKIFAVMYNYKKKNILLVRQPTYGPTDFPVANYLKAYAALFDQYQSLVDVLVVDQTHNPGGDGSYCSGFFSLFAPGESKAAVEFVRADRKWIFDLKIDAQAGLKPDSEESLDLMAMGNNVEKAYDANQFLTPSPLGIFSGGNTLSSDLFLWKKPLLILADELAGSCGDVFPMLVKANKSAKIFGNRTIGAGGNVEDIVTLTNSRASVHLTRGLFTTFDPNGKYPAEDFVENNGVTPDIQYIVKVDDYLMGFTKYVQAFSDAALAQIPAAGAKATASPFDGLTAAPDDATEPEENADRTAADPTAVVPGAMKASPAPALNSMNGVKPMTFAEGM